VGSHHYGKASVGRKWECRAIGTSFAGCSRYQPDSRSEGRPYWDRFELFDRGARSAEREPGWLPGLSAYDGDQEKTPWLVRNVTLAIANLSPIPSVANATDAGSLAVGPSPIAWGPRRQNKTLIKKQQQIIVLLH